MRTVDLQNRDAGPWPAGALPAKAFLHEDSREAVLESYDPDSIDSDPELTEITAFAAKLCGAPVALVTLVEQERQRFLARSGLEQTETPRSVSFCAHAMLLDSTMEVPDAREDERFAANPLVTGPPHIRFYAGHPLISDEGAPLGALCVLDTEPHGEGLNEFQRQGLAVLGQAVMRRLRAHREAMLARRELSRSEANLRALADSIPAIAWSANAEGKMDYFNRRLQEMTGEAECLNGDSIHPDDFEQADALWQESIRTGEPYELEHRVRNADGSYRWMLARAEPIRDEDGAIIRWFGTATDIDEVHRVSEHRDLLARELSHRIKNIFAVVSGLVSLSARKRPEHKDFADELIGTIRSLGRAHDYVRPGGERRGTLLGMLADLFNPYGKDENARVRVHGDDLAIAARAATPLALVFHELATNSAKYGALSSDEGMVDLAVIEQGDEILLRWEEKGGPPPASEMKEGFGSRLVEMSVRGQLQGNWERRFEPEGLVCELTVARGAVVP